MNTKQKIFAGGLVALVTLGGGGLLKSTFAEEAKGNTQAVATAESVVKPVNARDVNVPMKDARVNGVDAVKGFAAHVSKDGLLLVHLGSDQKLLNKTIEAAQEAIAEGKPLRGIVIGPMDQPPEVILYVDGLPVSYKTVMRSKENILASIREADRDILKPDLLAVSGP